MTQLNRAGQLNSLGNIDTTQRTFQSQIDVVSDELRQLAGNAEIPEEALNAPYLLYVNPNTGKDTYVSGDYKTTGDPAQRISLQRLECGYTEAAPFRTVSRACLEAAIITSRDYQTAASKQNALVSIVVMTGNHVILNDKGTLDTAANFPAWDDGKVPTDDELATFNPRIRGGLILPRGASLVSLDLRKTILRPSYVPTPEDEAPDLSNRTALLRVTGQCYLYGFTLRDKEGANYSHHLISGFEYANEAELDELYSKVLKTFAGVSAANAVPQTGENTIVGPQPTNPVEPVDTTGSASPYIYNTSLRSEWGFCGMFADGAEAAGFKSMVVAQYTGVSLQRDLTCWQKYVSGEWVSFTDYTDLISTDPDNVRGNPARRSFHVRTSNGAVVQEVSVFAIGQNIHHFAESGSQITITNSNSNFGGCSALADGFQTKAAPGDTPWSIEIIRRAVNPLEKTSNIKRLFLGQLEESESNVSTTLDLVGNLSTSVEDPTQPDLLVREGYSLQENDYIWIENPGGPDYRAQLAATPWVSSAPNEIKIKTIVRTDNASGNVNPDDPNADDNVFNNIEGKRVYIRRLRDVRSVEERRNSIIVSGGLNKVRLPVRDYVIQPLLGGDWSTQLQAVAESERTAEVINGSNVELRYSKRPDTDTDFDTTVYYRKSDVVRRENKHWFSTRNNYGPWNPDGWSESYVHMEETYAPEGFYSSATPIISFDKDTAQDENSLLLGNSLSDTLVKAQMRSAVDYQGVFYLLLNLGYTKTQAHALLETQSTNDVDEDVSTNNWNVDFRRPTNIRLYSHAYEWAGYNNYSKALPQYQGELSPNNKFTFFFTNQDGGKVYVSGFNEEGFQITNRGVEDLTTGKVLGLEEIGNPDRDISFPTVFDDLQVINSLNVEGAEIIGMQTGLTTRVGGGEIAGIQEIESATKANNNADLDKTQPTNFLTPEGLKYWASWANVVTQRPTIEILYIVPDNAVQGSSYVWNGVTATLNANPNRNANDSPPTTKENACKFSNAVAYANANFSSQETLQYRLANGPYWAAQTFLHVAQIVGASASFPSSNVLSDFNTSVFPTTNVKELMDTMSIPVFATVTRESLSSTSRRCNALAIPVRLNFNEGGSINGVAWLGAEETFSNTINFPDSLFYALGPYRSSGTVAEAIDDYFASQAIPSNYIFDRYTCQSTIRVQDNSLNIRNTIFGATAPGVGAIGYRGVNPIVFATDKSAVSFSGVYLLGNITATGFPKTAAKGIVVSTVVTGTRHGHELVGGVTSTSKALELSVYFPFVTGINQVPGTATFERDIDVNCIHLLDNNGRYALMSNRNATNGTRGPCLNSIIGQLASGSKLYTGGYSSYRIGFTVAGHQHGFAGVFGTRGGFVDGPTGIQGGNQPLTLIRNSSYSSSVWQQARTGTSVTSNVTPTSAPGTDEVAYDVSSNNVLNIRSHIWYQGLDVTNGQTVGGYLSGGVFYG